MSLRVAVQEQERRAVAADDAANGRPGRLDVERLEAGRSRVSVRSGAALVLQHWGSSRSYRTRPPPMPSCLGEVLVCPYHTIKNRTAR